MNKLTYLVFSLAASGLLLQACGGGSKPDTASNQVTTRADVEDDFQYLAEQFADLKLIRYQIPGWDKLTAKQKEYVYYLYEAGLSGRDIIWDQNYRHNLAIRKALESIINSENAENQGADWDAFMTY